MSNRIQDGNYQYSEFETLESSIIRQRNCYERKTILWLKNEENKAKSYEYTYFTPIMTIMNGVVANLNAVIKFNPGKKDRPKMIKLEFGEGCKELSVSPSTLPIKEGAIPITITCSGEFDKEQVLLVKADEKECGKIRILPNAKQHQKEIKVVVIQVKTCLNETQQAMTGTIAEGGPELFIETLKQALITVPEGVKYIKELDCTNKEFTEAYCKELRGSVVFDFEKAFEMKGGLNKILYKFHKNTYDEYYKLFIFADKCPGINGYAFFDEKHACFFNGHNASTVGHEVYHCLGLAHTFDYRNPERCEIDYKYKCTNNMLDYSHHADPPITRNSLFYLQWKYINSLL